MESTTGNTFISLGTIIDASMYRDTFPAIRIAIHFARIVILANGVVKSQTI